MKITKGNTITYTFKGEVNKITCVDVIENEHRVFGTLYKFDNGMALYELELESNLDLWRSRGGFEIA
jgi:hypothetical protein